MVNITYVQHSKGANRFCTCAGCGKSSSDDSLMIRMIISNDGSGYEHATSIFLCDECMLELYDECRLELYNETRYGRGTEMTDARAAELLRKEYEEEWNYAYLDSCPTKKAFQHAIKVLEK